MAFKLSNSQNNIILTVLGCTGSGSKDCGKMEVYKWNSKDTRNVNATGRLFLILSLDDKQAVAADIIAKYHKRYTTVDAKEADGLNMIKESILEKLDENKTWHKCSKCPDTFGEMIYLPLNVEHCTKHRENEKDQTKTVKEKD